MLWEWSRRNGVHGAASVGSIIPTCGDSKSRNRQIWARNLGGMMMEYGEIVTSPDFSVLVASRFCFLIFTRLKSA